MTDFWSTKEFKKLQKEWYGRLAEGGFKDAELNTIPLDADTAHAIDMEAVQQFYVLVSQYLHYGTFQSPIEKTIWFVFGEGYSIRNVARILHLSRKTVTIVINEHLKKMKHGLPK